MAVEIYKISINSALNRIGFFLYFRYTYLQSPVKGLFMAHPYRRSWFFLLSAFLLIYSIILSCASAPETEESLPSQSTRQEEAANATESETSEEENAQTVQEEEEIVEYPGFYREYRAGESGGIQTAGPAGTWEQIWEGIPGRNIYPFDTLYPPRVAAIGYDPLHSERVAVSTGSDVYFSSDRGENWNEVPINSPIRRYDYITSVAVSPHNENTYTVGTSFFGFFQTRDSGGSWTDLSLNAEYIHQGDGFYEEISAIIYDVHDPDILYFSTGADRGFYTYNIAAGQQTELTFPENSDAIEALAWHRIDGQWRLEAAARNTIFRYNEGEDTWEYVTDRETESSLTSAEEERLAAASNRFGLYASPQQLSLENRNGFFDFMEEHGLNMLLIDVKDDYGRLTYESEIELAHQIDAVYPVYDLPELIEAAHSRGISVTGRLVTFKDRSLYYFNDNQYAIWDSRDNLPWGHTQSYIDEDTGERVYYQREHWVDPYAQFVWDYNIAIAQELEDIGIDEVQFDYIRFPSDGDIQYAEYRHRRQRMNRVDALESFLRKMRSSVSLPISADLYGFNCWALTNFLGQNISMFSQYVDVICPMFYPSHFSDAFLGHMDYFERADYIYRMGSNRAERLSRDNTIIRPYVQAFLLGSEWNFTRDGYWDYLSGQLRGVQDSRANGFTLWSMGNDYFMLIRSLEPFTE